MSNKRTPPGSGAGPTKDAGERGLSIGIVALRFVRSKPGRRAPAAGRWPDDDETAETVDDEVGEEPARGRP